MQRSFFAIHVSVFLTLLFANEIRAEVFVSGLGPVVIDSFIDDNVRVSVAGMVTVENGAHITGGMFVDNAFPFEFNGGIVDVGLSGDVDMTFTGGIINGDIYAADWAVYEILGGQFNGALKPFDTTTIFVYGSSFNHPFGPISELGGNLEGILANGTPISVEFMRSNSAANIVLVGVPEPNASLFFCLTGTFLASKRRRKVILRSPL